MGKAYTPKTPVIIKSSKSCLDAQHRRKWTHPITIPKEKGNGSLAGKILLVKSAKLC